jgi:hypothetical protein
VVVFDSVNPDFYLAHYDLDNDPGKCGALRVGPTGPIVHRVGPWVTEQLGQRYLAVDTEAGPDQIGRLIQPHPTLSESFGENVLALTWRRLHLG